MPYKKKKSPVCSTSGLPKSPADIKNVLQRRAGVSTPCQPRRQKCPINSKRAVLAAQVACQRAPLTKCAAAEGRGVDTLSAEALQFVSDEVEMNVETVDKVLAPFCCKQVSFSAIGLFCC